MRHIRNKLQPRKKTSIFYKDQSPRNATALCGGEITSLDFSWQFSNADRPLICQECLRAYDDQKAVSSAAAALGRKGGSVKSARKTAAVRENGKKGGRPRKITPTPN